MIEAKLDAYIDSHMDDLLADLKELISYDSELTEPAEGAPFGIKAAECVAACEAMLKRHGLPVRNHEFYALSADLEPSLEPGLDILAHLDVVPAGNGWTVTDPFTMKIVGDKVYGRGTSDDKGPALCALYAMLALRDCGVKLSKNVRLILGSDEESGSRDLQHYFRTEKSAPMSLSPDAEFPCINIEKGSLHPGFTAATALPEALPRIISIDAGIRTNVVPDSANAVVEGLDESAVTAIFDTLSLDGCRLECEKTENGLSLTVRGKTAHASLPQDGINAITALLRLLAALPLSTAPLHDQIKALAVLFPHGDYNGKALGVALEDDISGKTTLTLDILHYDAENGLLGVYDCRACLSANDENTTAVIAAKLSAAGIKQGDRPMNPPHHVPADSFLVRTLMEVYNTFTGRNDQPLCIGGGTYVHHIDNGVAFGCCSLDVDTHMHGADEFMPIEYLNFGTKIYARAILRLCGNAD